jgi:hypothetical protein
MSVHSRIHFGTYECKRFWIQVVNIGEVLVSASNDIASTKYSTKIATSGATDNHKAREQIKIRHRNHKETFEQGPQINTVVDTFGCRIKICCNRKYIEKLTNMGRVYKSFIRICFKEIKIFNLKLVELFLG